MNERHRHRVYYYLPYFLNATMDPPLRSELLDGEVPTPKWVSWMQWADETENDESIGVSADEHPHG